MSKVKQLPRRDQVKPADTWDLASLFPDDAAWETAFTKWEKQHRRLRRRFAASWPTSAKTLAACLKFDTDFDRAGERLGTYAFLKTAEDTANSTYQRMHRPLSQRRQPRGPGGQLHPARDHGHSRPRR